VAATHCLFGLDHSMIDGAKVACLFKHVLAVATDDLTGIAGLPNGQSERPANQASTDNRDLMETHSAESSETISLFWMLRMMSMMLSKIRCKSVLESGPWLAREMLRSTSRSRSCSRIGMSVLRLMR